MYVLGGTSTQEQSLTYSSDYTYPALAAKDFSIQVDRPCTSQDRIKYRAFLQKYFQLKPEKTVKALPTFHPVFMHEPSIEALETQHLEAIRNYRTYTLRVSMKPSAYRNSHKLELFLPAMPAMTMAPFLPAQAEVIVGAVAVLKRSDPSQCANCVTQDAADRAVQGEIVISSQVTLYLMERYGINVEGTTEEEIMALLSGALQARVLSAGRDVLAEARAPGDEPPEVAVAKRITEAKDAKWKTDVEGAQAGFQALGIEEHPSATTSSDAGTSPYFPSMRLMSGAAVKPAGEEEGPIQFVDWKELGALPHHWNNTGFTRVEE